VNRIAAAAPHRVTTSVRTPNARELVYTAGQEPSAPSKFAGSAAASADTYGWVGPGSLTTTLFSLGTPNYTSACGRLFSAWIRDRAGLDGRNAICTCMPVASVDALGILAGVLLVDAGVEQELGGGPRRCQGQHGKGQHGKGQHGKGQHGESRRTDLPHAIHLPRSGPLRARDAVSGAPGSAGRVSLACGRGR